MRKIDEQRYLWLFRVFGIFLVLSIFLNIILLISFDKISPTPKREIFFISSQDKDIETLYITDINRNFEIAPGNIGDEIAKNYISEYIVDRESLFSNHQKMQKLWGVDSNFRFLSSESLYKDFLNSSYYEAGIINKDKKIITVNVENITYQTKSKEWIADVKLKITDSAGLNPEEKTKKIKVTAKFLTQKREVKSAAKWKNPLGFQITSYEYLKY